MGKKETANRKLRKEKREEEMKDVLTSYPTIWNLHSTSKTLFVRRIKHNFG